jgi:hypothetical protein
LGSVTQEIKYKTDYIFITISDVNKAKQNFNLSIKGTITPLKTQKPIKTRKGTLLLSEFSFYDYTGQIKLLIWGRLPDVIFNNRYRYTKVVIRGIKIREFKQEKHFVIQRNPEIDILQTKMSQLHKFLHLTNENESFANQES